MLIMRATKDPTDPVGEFIRSQQTVGLYNLSLAMNPFGLYGVRLRTLLGKQATHDPHSAPALLNFSVVPALDPRRGRVRLISAALRTL
jgi:hypothetical protein